MDRQGARACFNQVAILDEAGLALWCDHPGGEATRQDQKILLCLTQTVSSVAQVTYRRLGWFEMLSNMQSFSSRGQRASGSQQQVGYNTPIEYISNSQYLCNEIRFKLLLSEGIKQ